MEESTSNGDRFKASFKYYKSNKPKPSLENVLSVNNYADKVIPITKHNIIEDRRTTLLGLKSNTEWKSYTFKNHPGLILIQNPFTKQGQKYWIKRCLRDYPKKTNKTNIDIEMEIPDWWAECYKDGQCNMNLRKKLRWTTLGYHHNWDTKRYTDDNHSPFPCDLAELSDVIARHLHFTFEAEAAIVNYYHMDSTLSAHTDHSECNLDAPLFSFSFGQSAIFLIGGGDKAVAPSAILLQSGDIVVMSEEARLCYHAVPKILRTETTPWEELKEPCMKRAKVSMENHREMVNIENTTDNYVSDINLSEENNTDINVSENISCKLTQTVQSNVSKNDIKDVKFKYLNNNQVEIINNMDLDTNWNIFANYVEESRINMNVRQVLNERQKCLADL